MTTAHDPSTHPAAAPNDRWYQWLMHSRHADDPQELALLRSETARQAERVLVGAQLQPGMTLVDLGCGDGLVGLRAAEILSGNLRLILTDISAPLLDQARASAAQRGMLSQCVFIECNADDLSALPDASVDAVTTRSVLAYVAQRQRAFDEIWRVLRPGGRLSVAEPMLIDEARFACALRAAVEAVAPAERDLFLTLLHRVKAAQFPDTQEAMAACPMTSYTERDLVTLACNSGFGQIHMELHIDVRPSRFSSWHAFMGSAPHPLAPSLSDVLRDQFSADERAFFEQQVRPGIEDASTLAHERMVYLTAQKAV